MIKIFEEYNQYYTEVDTNVFYDLCDYNTLVFSNAEISFLTKELDVDINLRNNIKYTDKHTFIFYKESISDRIYIYKLPDEWYVVERELNALARLVKLLSQNGLLSNYYKCDQIEGVIKCIKEI